MPRGLKLGFPLLVPAFSAESAPLTGAELGLQGSLGVLAGVCKRCHLTQAAFLLPAVNKQCV